MWWGCTIAALGPVVWFVAFASLVVRARLVTNAWPVPYEPDPGVIGGLLYPAVFASLPLLSLFGPVYVVGLTVAWCVPRFRQELQTEAVAGWHLVISAAGIAALWIFSTMNPWQLFTWLAD